MVQQGEHSTNYSSWSTYLNSSSNFKQAPICMQKNLFQNSYCYVLEITPLAIIESENHETCIKKHTLLQWWIRWVIQILSIPWITRIHTVSSYDMFTRMLFWNNEMANFTIFHFFDYVDKFEMTSLPVDYHVFMVIEIMCL